MTIARDPESNKKIWVSGVRENQKFHALLNPEMDERLLDTVPPQTAGNYRIEVGCPIYDGDEKSLLISLDNPADCAGISGDEVTIGQDGVKVGDLRVGTNGTLNPDPVTIGQSGLGIKVDLKAVGVTFIGTKSEKE